MFLGLIHVHIKLKIPEVFFKLQGNFSIIFSLVDNFFLWLNLCWNIMWNFIICIEIHWILNNWKTLRSEVLRWPIAFFFEIGKAWLLNILETHKILLFFYRIVIESRLNAKNKYERVWIFFLSWINFRTKIGNLSFFFERLFFLFTLFARISTWCLSVRFDYAFDQMLGISSENVGRILGAAFETIAINLLSFEQKRAHSACY